MHAHSKHKLCLTIYVQNTNHWPYSLLNSETTDNVVDINVKCKHSKVAGNVVN